MGAGEGKHLEAHPDGLHPARGRNLVGSCFWFVSGASVKRRGCGKAFPVAEQNKDMVGIESEGS